MRSKVPARERMAVGRAGDSLPVVPDPEVLRRPRWVPRGAFTEAASVLVCPPELSLWRPAPHQARA